MFDCVVVGGGIAGGAFATVMSRAGARVLMLERQADYRDRVRGELMWPWGVAEVQRLGLEDVLLDAGANIADRFVDHDEGGSEPAVPTDLSAEVPGAPGSMNLFHPTATRALVESAADASARVVFGAQQVTIEAAPPTVSWKDPEGRHSVACGLVVGADGRSSTVRAQAGIELHKDPTAHLATGLLVEGLEVDERTNLTSRASDVLFLAFPQHDGRARLYLCFPTEQRHRFAGADGAERFLSTVAQVPSLPDAEQWASATPAGPCATFACADTWVDRPFADGVALIGDAGGYNNPLIGQGLSLAVRDAGVLTDHLLADGGVTQAAVAAYGAERTERLRRARISCLLDSWAHDGINVQDPDERARRYDRMEADEVLAPLMAAQWKGFDLVPRTPSDDEARERLFAKD